MALASANGWRIINGGHVVAPDCPVHHRTIRCVGQLKDAMTNSTVGVEGMERNQKNVIRRMETSIKNLEIFLVDSLCGYCCEPSQRMSNRIFLYYIKVLVSTIVPCHFLQITPHIYFKLIRPSLRATNFHVPNHAKRWPDTSLLGPTPAGCSSGPGTTQRPVDHAGSAR
jgi:hypothetical protein